MGQAKLFSIKHSVTKLHVVLFMIYPITLLGCISVYRCDMLTTVIIQYATYVTVELVSMVYIHYWIVTRMYYQRNFVVKECLTGQYTLDVSS